MTGIQMLLQVPFSQKEQAKALGAYWSSEKCAWYVPYGVDVHLFRRWWLRGLKAQMKEVQKKGLKKFN